MADGKQIVVIGGGMVGLSAAYHLAAHGGAHVTVIEKDAIGAGASGRAAGITTGLLWSETGVRVRQLSLETLRSWSRELEGYTFHDEQGCLNLFTPEAWNQRAALLGMYDRLGAPYEVMDAAAIRRRWEVLKPEEDLIGLHDPCGGYSETDELMPALRARIEGMGVVVREGMGVAEIGVDNGCVNGVVCDGALIGAEVVICTVNVWTAAILGPLGYDPATRHFVHQRYVTRELWGSNVAVDSFPAVNADPYGGYVRPASGGAVLIGVETPDRTEHRVDSTGFCMDDLNVDNSVRDPAAKRLASLLPILKEVYDGGAHGWDACRAGLISFSMDGEPIVGPMSDESGVSGLFVAAGFHSGGFSYAPGIGSLLAQWVMAGWPGVDLSAFGVDRFGGEAAREFFARTLRQRDMVRRRH